MILKIHHVAFRTHDLTRLVAFYTEFFPFLDVRKRTDESVWLDAGEATLMLERARENESHDLSSSMELVAFLVTKEERTDLRSRLISSGFAIDGETDFTTYVRDPDGRRIGFSHYEF